MIKTVIIGVDAATWRMITPLIERGELLNIRELMNKGSYGALRSTIPPTTPLAWTSIATGVNPGKHGIYDFVAQDRRTYRVTPIDYSYLTRPAIWDIFNAYGQRVGVVNFPMAFPPPKVESFFISGLAPEYEDYAYPPQLNQYLRSQRYRIYPRFGPRGGAKQYFNEVRSLMNSQCDVTVDLMKHWNWEIFIVVFQGLDWVQHYFWNIDVDGKNAVETFYCYIDDAIGRLLLEAHDDWNIFILSDHGFREIKAEIHLNNLLEKWGYLKRTKASDKLAQKIRGYVVRTGWKLRAKMPLLLKQWVERHIPEEVRSNLRMLQKEQLRLHQMIDWDQTRAFSFGYMGRIYIHTKGKYPQGTVGTDEYEKLREEIIAQLRSLRDPETGDPVVGEVFRKEEIYIGDQLENAPDIIFTPSDFAYAVYGDFGDAWFCHLRDRVADHDMEGILIMKGKDISRGVNLNAEVVDIAPTLLYLHGLPVLEDMDGRVLQEAFTKELTKKREVKTIKEVPIRSSEERLGEKAQEEIEKRLRELGYL